MAPGASMAPGRRVIVRQGDGGNAQDVRIEVVRIGDPVGDAMPAMPVVMPLVPNGEGEQKSLGARDIDGVKVQGTQTTHTIPAGAIGNEKPIAIVSERWFSPELQLVVMASTRDPRSGVTTYRLTNLKRGEPPADLFKVPSGYRMGVERRGG
jgi:hypothetical protein